MKWTNEIVEELEKLLTLDSIEEPYEQATDIIKSCKNQYAAGYVDCYAEIKGEYENQHGKIKHMITALKFFV